MDISDNSRQLAPGPKARVCYICGRQYMVHSYDIHLKQCKELFLAREALKDPRERKKLPEDPMERLLKGGGAVGESETSSPDKRGGGGGGGSVMNSPATGGALNTEGMSLDEINRIASEAFNNEALARCAFCGRTFLPEKLAIHNKSCTAENPARRVNEGVRKGLPPADISAAAEQPRRPATSSGVPGTGKPRRSLVSGQGEHDSGTPKKESNGDGEVNLKLENGELRGHIGGMAGRNIRATKPNSSVHPPLDTSPIPDFATKEEGIEYLTSKIDILETMAGDIFSSIAEMKKVLGKIKELP